MYILNCIWIMRVQFSPFRLRNTLFFINTQLSYLKGFNQDKYFLTYLCMTRNTAGIIIVKGRKILLLLLEQSKRLMANWFTVSFGVLFNLYTNVLRFFKVRVALFIFISNHKKHYFMSILFAFRSHYYIRKQGRHNVWNIIETVIQQ